MVTTTTGNGVGVSLSRQRETTTAADIAAKAKNFRKTETSAEVATERFAQIKTNRFYKILADQGLSVEEKRNLFANAQIGDPELSLEQNQAALEELALFKEFLQAQRTQANKELVAMANSEAFAGMQALLKELNEAFHEFEDKMGPLVDILDAVHKLREAGKTSDVIREINNDKEWVTVHEAEAQKTAAEIEAKAAEMRRLRDEKITEENRKKFFFFSATDHAKVDRLQEQIDGVRAEREAAATRAQEIKDALARGPGSDHPEVAEQKAILAKMLNLSGEQLTTQQRELHDAALKYITFAETRTEKAFHDFEKMGEQMDLAANNIQRTQQVYTILDDSTKIAEVRNQEIRDQFKTAAEGESQIAKMHREQKLDIMDKFVQAVIDTKRDTTNSIASLESARMGVRVMQDNNRQNLIESRTIKSDGVAGISTQLVMTISSVGSAALWHSQEAAKESMRNMSNFNDRIMAQEAINVATRLEDVNADLVRNLEKVAALKDVTDSTIGLVRDGTRELLNNLERQAAMSEAFKKSQDAARGTAADVQGEHLGISTVSDAEAGKPAGGAGLSGLGNLFGKPSGP